MQRLDGLEKACPLCAAQMQEVIAAEMEQRAGWYCVPCKEFIKAIGRERYIKKGAGNGRATNQ